MMNRSCVVPILTVGVLLLTGCLASADDWYTRRSDWHGFDQFHFQTADQEAWIVVPEEALPGNPWIWRARFPGYHAEMDQELVRRGFHLAYVDVAGLFGSPKAISIGEAFYEFVTMNRELASKPALEGVSRGGLFVYNWAAKYPDRVACIYCDTPVMDFTSWPGGRGQGRGSVEDWKQCLEAYGFSEEEALASGHHLVNVAAQQLVSRGIPIMHIVSENDMIVPPAENTRRLEAALRDAGASLTVISVAEGTQQSNGHHFTHPAPQRVVEFIARHAAVPRLAP